MSVHGDRVSLPRDHSSRTAGTCFLNTTLSCSFKKLVTMASFCYTYFTAIKNKIFKRKQKRTRAPRGRIEIELLRPCRTDQLGRQKGSCAPKSAPSARLGAQRPGLCLPGSSRSRPLRSSSPRLFPDRHQDPRCRHVRANKHNGHKTPLR